MRQKLTTITDFVYRIASSRWFRIAILALFVVQALFLVFTMHPRTAPDEGNHIDFVEFYAEHSLGPVFTRQTPTWNLGDKTREIDYLYHYGASFVARAIPGQTADLYAIRITTVITALLTLLVLIKIFKRLKIGPAAINVGLLIVTNLPMVLMLSAAVNNDVAVWFGCALGVLLVLRLWQKPTLLDAVLLLDVSVLGGLAKRTMFPIGVVFVVALIVLVLRKWRQFKKNIEWKNWRVIAAFVVLLVGSGLFIERVGGNLLEYHSLTPSCEAVQGEKACSVFWANSRQAWLDSLPEGSSSDSSAWLGGATKDKILIPIPVFIVQWFGFSMFNIVDIQTQGWHHTVGPGEWVTPLLSMVLLLTTVFGIVYDIHRRRTDDAAYKRLAVVALAFFVIAIQLAVNYSTYRHDRVFGLALNGRYILPALLLLAGTSCFYASKFLGRRSQIILSVGIVLSVIVGSGLIMMVRNPQLFTG